MTDTILDVRDLRVEFLLARGLVRAVDGASFELRRGEALGPRRRVRLRKTMRCGRSSASPRQARLAGGEILFEGADLARASAEEPACGAVTRSR